MKRRLRSKVTLILLTLLLPLLFNGWPSLASVHQDATAGVPDDMSMRISLAYPPDPSNDIPWVGAYDFSNIEAAFNNARSVENSQLGTTTAALTMPSQATWDAMEDGERALWLINRERIDRGVMALHGIEENVWQSVRDLFMHSPSARRLVKEGKAKVLGAIYDVGTGRVEWLPESKTDEILQSVEQEPSRAMEEFAE